MACYKSEALSDAKRAVCLNPEWEKVSRKHGCLLTNISLVIIYTCSHSLLHLGGEMQPWLCEFFFLPF